MSSGILSQKGRIWVSYMLASGMLAACTGQLPSSFRYKQQEEAFTNQTKINTKIDLLWVIDNSSSMDVSQKALRERFAGFATKYLKPYWDIRIAVITTDTYLANPVFHNYLNSTMPASVNYQSKHLRDYVSTRVAAGDTTSNNDKLAKLDSLGVQISSATNTAGKFSLGLKYKQLVPAWANGTNYARLLPGIHDGPIAGFCIEKQPYFLADDDATNAPLVAGPQCKLRDISASTGVVDCLNPPSGKTSVTQCVNTVLNDTVHSGFPIIETKSDVTGAAADAWVQTLVDRFTVNASAGSAGSGSERGLGSVLEFIDQNESSDTAFFRRDSLRGIIFLSDEDDQTMVLPDLSSDLTSFTPDTNYRCDLNALVAANQGKFADPSDYIQHQYKYCCSDGTCALRNLGCSTRTVGNLTYSTGTCPDSSKLMAVSDVKTKLDTFFKNLDGDASSNGNYFVVAIVPTSEESITNLQTARYQSDDHLDQMPFISMSTGNVITQARLRLPAVDKGVRYLELVDKVNETSSGSLALDIGASDYSALLDSIGTTIVSKKGSFALNFAPSSKEDMLVKVVHADGSETVVQNGQFEFQGKNLVITDLAFVLSLKETDQIVINYQPKSLE